MKHHIEVDAGARFEFGKNWSRFLKNLNNEKISRAEDSLRSMLHMDSLNGKSFLDIGSGSGLFSLAACRLGATVTSFDYDPNSVRCAQELKSRFQVSDADWNISEGSVLDTTYLRSIGAFDIVYSWGVLHHTGALRSALLNVNLNVKRGGRLVIAIYNDQGWKTKFWKGIKAVYNRLPRSLRLVYTVLVYLPFDIRMLILSIYRLEVFGYFMGIIDYGKDRGMDWWRDRVDWIGGYPFEAMTPEDVICFYSKIGYRIIYQKRSASLGCNEFVFEKID